MTATPNRVTAGIPTGGQFATAQRGEADVELTDAPEPAGFGIGAAVTRTDYVTGKPISDGHVLGPAQMTRDSDGSEPYEVYPVQSADGRGLAGWWTTKSIVATQNPQEPKWPIYVEGSPQNRFRAALTDDTVFYVEDAETIQGVTEVSLRCPGGRFTAIVTDDSYSVIEHSNLGGDDTLLGEGANTSEDDGFQQAARVLEDVRICDECGGPYFGEDETGYDADGNGENRCDNCFQAESNRQFAAYSATNRNTGPSLSQQHADGVHEGKPMPGCTRCDDGLYRDA